MGGYVWFVLWCGVLCCLSLISLACAVAAKEDVTLDHGLSGLDGTYGLGPYNASRKNSLRSPCCAWSLRSSCCNNDLVVAVPTEEGEYPVVQFQHGTLLSGVNYEDVIDHIASWGFIVVAPRMYSTWLPPSDAIEETDDARRVLNWLSTGLVAMLSPWTVARPDLAKIALVGHSRGGKVVYGLALNVTNSNIVIPQFSAIVALDPVDGTGSQWPKDQLQPAVLNHKGDSLTLGVPTLVLGTGLGSQGWKPCAPVEFSHEYFFHDVAPPAFHFVAPKEGHMDFCKCHGWFRLKCWLCRGNPDASTRPQMRSFTGGIVVAFLQNALLHNSTAFDAAYVHYNQAPVALNAPDRKGQITISSTTTTTASKSDHSTAHQQL